jgi:TatD DNase family protein
LTASLVDFHCHLDLYPDFESVVRKCDDARIHTLAVTTTPKAWARNLELASRTKYVHAALGLHPQLIGSHGHEIDLWESLLSQAKFVGEVGLDAGPQYFKTMERQQQVFGRVLKGCDRAGGKILSVHSVRSTGIVLQMLEQHLSRDRSKVVLHWFTGSLSEAKRAVEIGCYFSINAQMAISPRGEKIVAELPHERLLTETDGPFAKTRGQPSRPGDVADSLRAIAAVRRCTVSDLTAIVESNYKTISEYC